MKTNSAVLLLAGILSATIVSAQTQITITTPPTQELELVGIDPPSGLSFNQTIQNGAIGADFISTTNLLAVGWNLPSPAANVTITAYISGGAPVTAYLTTQIGTGTTVSNQIATATVTGNNSSLAPPTAIFSGLNLAAGTYYLTLTSRVASNAPNVPSWYVVSNSPGPAITNAAGGFSGLYEGYATVPAGYAPASAFTAILGDQQTGNPTWSANLFDVISIRNASLPVGTQLTPYSVQFTASGGVGSYTWSTPGGGLPPGITLNSSTGLLSGTPTASGNYNFSVQATDTRSNFSQTASTLAINIFGKTITTNLPAGMAIVNVSGTQDGASASAGTGQSLWFQPFSTLGQLVEYTIQPGTYTFRAISPADAVSLFPSLTTAQQNSMWTAWTYNTPWLDDYLVFDSSAATSSTQSQLFSGAEGVPNDGVNSLNATTAYNWVIANNTYSNVYVGNRLAAPQRTYTFNIPRTLIFAVPDSVLSDNQGGVSVLIAPLASQPLNITTTSLFNGQVGTAYSPATLAASGGYGPPYTWSAGGLPPGLTVSAAGVLSGTPAHVGTYPVFFTVTDPVSGLSFTQTTPFNMTMGGPATSLSISQSSLPQGEINVAYNQTLTATGGYGSYTWSLTAPSITAPLSINANTGQITSSGPLTCCNTGAVSVTVTDAAGDTLTKNYSLLLDGPVSMPSALLPTATTGESYGVQLTATGGTTVYTWSVPTGSFLPAGLTLSPSGYLTGVPSVAGSGTFTVQVSDSAGGTATTTNPGLGLQVLLPVSYVAVNAAGGTAALSPNGSTQSTVATFVSGTDAVADPNGNIIVATGAGLTRVTPTGSSTGFVSAPSGSAWVAVAVDSFGNYIVGDNKAHAIWRVAPDGSSQTIVAYYTAPNGSVNEDIKILVDVHGNYIVAEDNYLSTPGATLFTVTPAGAVTPLTLTGTTLPIATTGLTFDRNGNYMLLDNSKGDLFRITPQGAVSVFYNGESNAGLVRNPVSNDYYTGSFGALLKLSAGSLTIFGQNRSVLPNPDAVLAIPTDFPSAVDATNPLGYFRLEAPSGTSDVNGYTYSLSGGATIANGGAPIGNPANNGVVLDGSTGFVTTNIIGGIQTAGSVMAWVYLGQLPSGRANASYIAGESANGNDFDLEFDTQNRVGFFSTCCAAGLYYTPNPNTLVNQWHMVVATFDAVAGTRSIYWDGQLAATGADTSNAQASYENKTGAFQIGASSVFSGRNFPGSIDEAAIWNYSLNANQVYAMYAAAGAGAGGYISLLSPSSAAAGGSNTTLTISGNNLQPESTVLFTYQGGFTTVLTPASVSANQVTVTIPAAQLALGGTAQIAVANPAGIPTNRLPFSITGAPLTIIPGSTTFPAGLVNQLYSKVLTGSGGSGNYSWSINRQPSGFTMSLSPATGQNSTLSGTPGSANTNPGFIVGITLTDTQTGLSVSATYTVPVNAAAVTATQPANTTAYVFSETAGTIVSITNGVESPFVSNPPACPLCYGYDIARDAAGNFILAADGQLSRYTSTGATSQTLPPIPAPQGSSFASVAVDANGNYIVADVGLHQVDQITPGGVITKIYSYPINNSSQQEDAYVRVDGAGKYILLEDNSISYPGSLSVFQITPAALNGGTPFGSQLELSSAQGSYLPQATGGFTFDAQGNYVNVDWNQALISTITPSGVVSNLYFDDFSILSDPYGIVRDPASGVYLLTDDANNALYLLTANGSSLAPIVSGGLLTAPGSLVVVDTQNTPPPASQTWVLESSNTIVPVGGGAPLTCPSIICTSGAYDFAADASGNFIVADINNLVKVTQAGASSVIAAAPNGSQFISVAVDSQGNYIVADNSQHRIVKVTQGGVITPISNYPISNVDELEDVSVRIDGAGNYIVADDNGSYVSVHRITPAGTVTNLTVTGRDPAGISGLALDASGNYLITDYRNKVIDTVTPAGAGSLLYANSGSTLSFPFGLFRDPSTNNILIADNSRGALYSLTSNGVTLAQVTNQVPGAIAVLITGATSTPLSITTTALPSATQNFSYAANLTATGGSGNYTWSATALPAGLSISGSGTLSGTPVVSGLYSVAITVTDANNTSSTATATLSLYVTPPSIPALTISSSATSVSTKVGGAVAATFTASGGTAPYTFSLSGQPGGVTIGTGGALSGSPTQPGNFNATVTVRDSGTGSAAAGIAINVLGLITSSLPNGTAGQFYSASLGATGGSSGYAFSATGMPAGLSLSSGGLLSGTVNTSGTYPLGVTVASGGVTVAGTLSVTFAQPQPLAISSATLPDATVNVLYSKTFTATGGFPPYTWSVISGTPPQGLSMNSAGAVSGTATTPGPVSFGIQVADTAGAIASAGATITVDPAPLVITTQSLPSGMINVDYPQQILGATGGTSPYTWALSTGSLPGGVTLSTGGVVGGVPTATGSFSPGITVTDHAGFKAAASLGVTVRPASADLVLTASSLGFSLLSPAAAPPASQTVGVQSTAPSQIISYSVSGSSPVWLSVSNGASTPDTMQVSITSAALSLVPGDYQATITATCTSSTCAGHTQTVSVDLNVAAAAPKLSVGTTLLSFATTTSNTGSIGQSISVQNAGGGTIGFASLKCEDTWCSAGTPPNLTGGSSAVVPVTVNPALLTPGFYRTQVDIVTSAGSASVPVTLFIAPNSTMTLAPAGNQFNMPAGSTPGNPNGAFLVSVNNPTPVNFTASVATASPYFLPSWLVLNTQSGTSTNAQPASVAFSIDPVASAALAPGAYYGLIQVVSTDIANSPQDYEVVLNVVPATTPIVPDPEPGGLLFITTVGGVVPPQNVSIYSGSVTPLTFQASAAVTNGKGWLTVSPFTGSASAGSPGVTTVTVTTTGLTAGVYRGGVSFSLSATAVRTVNVTLIVANPGGAVKASSVTRVTQPKALTCTPTALAPAQTGLVNNFSEPAAWPTPLVIQLSDDCGSAVNNGQIVATFTNGDPPLILNLADPTKALYSGTWSPRKAASQVAVNIRASAPGYPDATTQIAGAVVPNAAPLLTPHGTLHSFDPLIGAALAPGTIVAIYGQNLASLTTQPTTIPLPTVVNGTTVLVGGIPAPMYYVSAGQINAQIPFELQPGQQYQVIVSANGALTTPDSVQLSTAAPGLAAFGDGTLIAQHGDGSLVSAASPAKSGEYLVAYLAGLGNTNVNLASGAASPAVPLAIPTDTPALNINGGQYPLLFAGLTPGLVGLYQMNFQVPAGLPAGTITIALTQGGASSNQTTLPYQP